MEAPMKPMLSEMASGAAEDLFSAAVDQVLANIDDPNTDAKAARTITLTITFRPNEERTQSTMQVKCATKLAGVRPVGTLVFMGRRRGKLAMVEALGQETLFPAEESRPTLAERGN